MASTTSPASFENLGGLFEWPEYLVFGTVLASSAGIGIFFGCFGSKNATNAEYLLGNKQMHPVPVALSLLCSYVSSITLLGHPVEIYLFGTQLAMALLCYIPLTLSLLYLYVPFYFNLQVTSIYEYLEMRFSPLSRSFLSLVNFIYSIFYMALVVYGPALALSQVTGLHHHVLVGVMFTVCIFYSSIGGIKAVLWTDSLQAVIMFASMAAVVGLGLIKVGGISVAWERAKASGRIGFFNLDPDPRTRHTFWTAIVGGYFTWLPMYTNQAQFQRYVSLPSIKDVKKLLNNRALLINMFGLWIIMGLCYVGGLVIYATYYKCDPLTNGDIKTIDQLLPKFVMDTLENYPGLPGLFVSGITCAGLSTVSSVVNSLAANIVEDYVKKWKSDLSESKLAVTSKIISVVTGLIGFGFVFLAEQMGSIFSAATTFLGILGGPTLGLFISGMFFPWVNSWGANAGMIVTFAFMAFLGFGSRYNKDYLPVQILALDVSGCHPKSFLVGPKSSISTDSTSPPNLNYWKDQEYNSLINFFSISDLWYPALGCIMSVALGISFSLLITHGLKIQSKPMKSRLFVPLMLKIWRRICPNQISKLVIFDTDDNQQFEGSDLNSEPVGKNQNDDSYDKSPVGIEINACSMLSIVQENSRNVFKAV